MGYGYQLVYVIYWAGTSNYSLLPPLYALSQYIDGPPYIPSGPFTCVNLFIANATDVWSLWGAVVWEVATAKLVWKFFRQRLNSDWANVDMSYFRSELLLFLSFLSGKNACPPQAFYFQQFWKVWAQTELEKFHHWLCYYSLVSNNHYVTLINFSKIGPLFCPY